MMGLDERLLWLLFGCAIGFILGYIVRSLRDIKDELDEVANEVTPKRKRTEAGFMRRFGISDLALLAVVILTVWAAFASSKASSDVHQLVTCTTKYNISQGDALTSRDGSVKSGTSSEITMWERYQQLFKIAQSNPSKIPVLQRQLNTAIGQHIQDLKKLQKARSATPYPNPDVLVTCQQADGSSAPVVKRVR